jgi:hypothetical protein
MVRGLRPPCSAGFWSHVRSIDEVAGQLLSGPSTVTIGILWGITIVGFVLALVSTRRSEGAAGK